MKVIFKESTSVAHNIRNFYFEPERPVRFTAGQFIELYLPHESPDNRGTRRWFTLSSAPSDPHLSITTNFNTERSSTFKVALQSLKPGTELNMQSPMGDFVLPKQADIPLVFVAGGIGCTPFHSIVSELQQTGMERDITLIYSAHHAQDVAFRETFERLGKKFIIIYQDPPAKYSGPTGRLSAELIHSLTTITDEHYVYISGPEPMVETLNDQLKKSGISKKHIHTDFFPNYLPEF